MWPGPKGRIEGNRGGSRPKTGTELRHAIGMEQGLASSVLGGTIQIVANGQLCSRWSLPGLDQDWRTAASLPTCGELSLVEQLHGGVFSELQFSQPGCAGQSLLSFAQVPTHINTVPTKMQRRTR